MNASRNKPGWLASLGNVNSRPRYRSRYGINAMCCFSQDVGLVSNTNIFARGNNGSQFLVYQMTYSAAHELAMVLPLPVLPRPPDDAVRFINLEVYPLFFEHMQLGFPSRSA